MNHQIIDSLASSELTNNVIKSKKERIAPENNYVSTAIVEITQRVQINYSDLFYPISTDGVVVEYNNTSCKSR